MSNEVVRAFEDSHGLLLQGDVRACLAAMEPESVQCVVTSPPYWGLRSYATEPQIWGGTDPACDHGEAVADEVGTALDALWEPTPGLPPMTGGSGPASAKQVTNAGSQFGNAFVEHTHYWDNRHAAAVAQGLEGKTIGGMVNPDRHMTTATCTRCGAWRGELGSEPLHDCAGWATGAPCGACFICHLVEVFTAVKRILRPDGVCLVNLGDSYAGSGTTGRNDADTIRGIDATSGRRVNAMAYPSNDAGGRVPRRPAPGLKAKDLVGIPWRFALAMQAAGWWLRGDYIWSKPNPMPESVTDRCTRSHEYIFHFSKASTYYWDADAIRETAIVGRDPDGAAKWSRARLADPDDEREPIARQYREPRDAAAGRNARSVWEIATESFPGAHFATYPRALVRRAILAGTSEKGACSECGSPWKRQTSNRYEKSPVHGAGSVVGRHYETGANGYDGAGMPRLNKVVDTVGWAPTCAHTAADVVPCVCLDPFAGSSTTLLVARQLGRFGLGCELQPDYVAMSLKRLRQHVLL